MKKSFFLNFDNKRKKGQSRASKRNQVCLLNCNAEKKFPRQKKKTFVIKKDILGHP